MTDIQVEKRLDILDGHISSLSSAVKSILEMINTESLPESENFDYSEEGRVEELDKKRDKLIHDFTEIVELHVKDITYGRDNVELKQFQYYATSLKSVAVAIQGIAGPDGRYHMAGMVEALLDLFLQSVELYIVDDGDV